MAKPVLKQPTKVDVDAADDVFDLEILQELEAGLKIDRNALDEALLEQPQAFYHVSEKLALWTSRRDAAKQQQQLVEARVDAKIRHDADVAQEKITEREVESQKRMHKEVREAQDELLQYNHTVNRFAALKEAYQQRGYVVKELVALYIGNYYSQNSAGSGAGTLKTRAADDAKQAMHRERQRVSVR